MWQSRNARSPKIHMQKRYFECPDLTQSARHRRDACLFGKRPGQWVKMLMGARVGNARHDPRIRGNQTDGQGEDERIRVETAVPDRQWHFAFHRLRYIIVPT